MNFIPRFIMPHEDELLFSWIIRLANANCFELRSFMAEYIFKEKKYNKLGYDCRTIFLPICQHSRVPINIQELFEKHSTFNLDGIVMSAPQQAGYINSIFRPNEPLNIISNNRITTLKYCPECAKYELKAGLIPYLHASHNLSGVNVCAKHHCVLKQFVGKWGHELEFNNSNYKDIIPIGSIEANIVYANYVISLNKINLTCNIKDIKTIVFDKLQDLHYTKKDDYKSLQDDLSQWKYKSLLTFNINSFLRAKLTSATSVLIIELIPLLMFLFPDVDELINRLQIAPVLQTYICSECGYKYVSTAVAQKDGWGCPECNMKLTPDEVFERVVETSTDGEYLVIGSSPHEYEEIALYHKKCEEVFNIKVRSFLYEGLRCNCANRIPLLEAKKTIEHDGDFEIVSFRSVSRPVSIKHKKCGYTFEYNFGHFIDSPHCKLCHSHNGQDMKPEIYRAKVKELVGDEYEVIQDFQDQDTKVVLRHKECGHEQEYWPKHFLDGQRCRKCNHAMPHDELLKLIQDYGKGRYQVIDFNKNLYTLLDTEENKEIKLSPNKIRQEIVRPTMSNIIPVKQKEHMEVLGSWDMGYQHLLQYKKEHGHVNVPKREIHQGYNLGTWCQHQRSEFVKGTLQQNRLQKLQDIGFVFDIRENEWDRRCEQYARYIQQTGSPKITRRIEFEGEKLGIWIDTQRMKKDILSPERREKLKRLNPDVFG